MDLVQHFEEDKILDRVLARSHVLAWLEASIEFDFLLLPIGQPVLRRVSPGEAVLRVTTEFQLR